MELHEITKPQQLLQHRQITPGTAACGLGPPRTVPARGLCRSFCGPPSTIGVPLQADPTIHQRPARSAFRTLSQDTRSSGSVPAPTPRTCKREARAGAAAQHAGTAPHAPAPAPARVRCAESPTTGTLNPWEVRQRQR